MSKKILFMSSAKLTALSIGLLLAVFCTIGMSFRPVYDEDEAAEIVMSGPRRSHYYKKGMITLFDTNHYEKDFAKATASTAGNGYVTLSSPSGGGLVTNPASYANGTTLQSGSNSGASVSISWNCNHKETSNGKVTATAEMHTRKFTIEAFPNKNYYFKGWSTSTSEGDIFENENPYTFDQIIDDWNAKKGSHEADNKALTTIYYAIFKQMANLTFAVPENGSYTFSTEDVPAAMVSSSTGEKHLTTKKAVTLEATPAPGYKFFGWYVGSDSPENYLSYSTSFENVFDGDATICAKFVPTATALFTIKETTLRFYDFNTACSTAASGTKKVVVPLATSTLSAGDYTIPSGVTLLIPYDDQYTLKTTEPGHTRDATTRTRYLELTLANGAVIDVYGSISVGCNAIYAGAGGNMSGYIIGAYGQVNMQSGSEINMRSGSNLYCWGYIIGSGNVNAYTGSKLYEAFQFDFRGGTHVTDAKAAGCLPMNQYYVQNIEAPLTIYSNVSETLYTAAYARKAAGGNVSFVGDNGLFKLLDSEASLTRHYDSATDRIIYDVYGNAQIQNVNVSISLNLPFFPSISMNSSDYVLPITNNMDINIHSGTTSILYATELLAGARVVIDEGATVKLRNNLFVYDKDDYVGKNIAMNVDLNPITYSPTKTKTRTTADLTDAQIIVNGKLETYTESSSKGYLYTTTKGADICSNEKGVIVLTNGEGTKTTTIQNNGLGAGEQATQNIPVTSALLHNASQWYTAPYTGDNACEYLATAGAAANTTITYAHGHWGWIGIWKNWDGTILKVANTCLESELAAKAPTSNPTRLDEEGCTIYTFNSWSSDRNETNREIVYTATYDESTLTYEITYAKGSAANAAGSLTGGTKTCGVSNTLSSSSTAFTRTGYTYDGWSKNADGSTKDYELGGTYTANAAITLYPHWVLDAYTISYAAGTAEGAAGSLAGGTKTYDVSYTLSTNSTAFTRTGYTYDGWSVNEDGSTKDYALGAAYTANVARTFYPHWVINTYTLTLSVAPAEEYGTTTSSSITSIPHGSAVTTNGDKITVNGTTVTATPAATTAQYTYAFSSWTNPATITASATVTANFTRTTNQYTIVWKSEDGTSILETDADQPFGTSTAYNRATPTKAPTAQYTYTFDGWATEANGAKVYNIDGTPAVGGAATYYAHFNATVNNYTITWKNHDGSTLETDENVPYGTTPSYDGATPTKAADDDYTYTFADWSPAVASVTGDAAYTATFTPVLIPKGDRLDIIDVDNTAKTLTLNVAGWANAGWPYTINDDTYQKTARKEDRTMIIPYAGEVGEEMTITVKDKLSAIKSKYTYVIPTEITANTSISSIGANNVLYVKNNATLTVDEDKTMGNIYIAPGAKLIVSAGKTLTADKVLFRTTPWQSAELENNGTVTAQVYYTRIISSASQYYQFGLPRNCAISEVKLSDGSTPVYTKAWLLRSYSESSRAANGANGNNWTTLAAGGTIQGGVGYEMFSSSNYYREFYFPISLTPSSITTAVSYTEGAAGPTHAGWNIVVSPLTSRYTIAPEPEGWMISWLQEDGSYSQEPASIIKSAIPFAYQAKANGSLSFDSEFSIIVAAAPRRRVTAAEEPTRIQWIHLDIEDEAGIGDQTSIYSHPTRYEQTYQTGIDVAKQSLTASRAILYSSHAYGDMAFAGVADTLLESGVALTVYSPAAQELTFSLRDNDWLNRMESVWLIDKETGAKIDLLSSDYSYEAAEGTTRGRFFIQGHFKAPQVATELEPTSDSSLKGREIRKVIINQKMFIEVNGRWYDATGKEVKR